MLRFLDSSIKQAGSGINVSNLHWEGAQFEPTLGQAIMRPVMLFLTPSKAFPSHSQITTRTFNGQKPNSSEQTNLLHKIQINLKKTYTAHTPQCNQHLMCTQTPQSTKTP
jgi:hypothetical protein